MKFLLLIFFTLVIGDVASAQAPDTIMLTLVAGRQSLPGATLVIKDTNPLIGTITNMDGVAEMVIPSDKNLVEITIIGPYIRLKIEKPADSIYFDINSRKTTFYYKKRKMRSRKQVVHGY
jgi:hypothetical protein